MSESQSEFDIRMMKFKIQNLQIQYQSALAEMRNQLARLGDRVAALEQGAMSATRPSKKTRSSSVPKGEPEFDGI
jgi:hypothetical protein